MNYMHKQQQFVHSQGGSSNTQKCEGGDPKSPGIIATVSVDLHGPRAYKSNEICFFPIIINSKGCKLFS